jgi:hypothetical protein
MKSIRIAARSFLLLLTVSLVATGCSPVQLYQGPERSREEVVTLFFSSITSDIRALSIDGVTNPHPGRAVQVLPGTHFMQLSFQEHFEDSDNVISDGATFRDEASGFGFVRAGTCGIRFNATAGQALFVSAYPGSSPLLTADVPSRVEIQEEGFNMPILFSAPCQYGHVPIVKVYND